MDSHGPHLIESSAVMSRHRLTSLVAGYGALFVLAPLIAHGSPSEARIEGSASIMVSTVVEFQPPSGENPHPRIVPFVAGTIDVIALSIRPEHLGGDRLDELLADVAILDKRLGFVESLTCP